MGERQNLYCKIYLDCDISLDELIRTIAALVHGRINRRSVLCAGYEIDARKNEDFDENLRCDYPDGFLYYPYSIDIEPTEEILPILYKETIAKLLETFWDKNYQAVAACDFEDELPRKGGYKWK
ncbi:1,4-dihydroxy-6-naphthoate synthase [Dolichospermum sp. LEGE 00240]|uniref:1,4-dihydroxy-6-naphthoate synthase n=1 Tax=Dolichospermum sp. LEGE 00240 TaxID=1828603 RepID=UPI00188145E5|nr:1,4-dihydroxy-6-naphthoate synthase [Dolichospermum sp. LEGE 00240]MBE9252212.1 1,4-dihydroxy-6-naphthoate synthase [Dolichospermum sp. LEGE 00240]MDM3853040.1 hypothetical protein [Aphanizomenon gracile PMC627.10]